MTKFWLAAIFVLLGCALVFLLSIEDIRWRLFIFTEAAEEPYDPGDGHQFLGGAFKLARNIKSGIKALEPMTGEVLRTFEVAPRDHTVQVGGVLPTGVVFQGNLETFYGLRGDDGSVLWSVNLGGLHQRVIHELRNQ